MQENNPSLYISKSTEEDIYNETVLKSTSSSSSTTLLPSGEKKLISQYDKLYTNENSSLIDHLPNNGNIPTPSRSTNSSSILLLSPKRRTLSTTVSSSPPHLPLTAANIPSTTTITNTYDQLTILSPKPSPKPSPKRKSIPSTPQTPSSIRSNHMRNSQSLLPVLWMHNFFRLLPTRIRLLCCQSLVWGSPIFRFSMLFLSMAVLISGYFSYDLPGITSTEIKSTLNLNNASFGALFSVYALPNSIMPLFSGAYFTKVGVWKGVLVISSIITLGIWIISIAVAQESYILLLIGRAIYGIGGDSIYVGIDVLATGWFRDNEIGLAYGIIQAAGQAGSFIAFYGVPSLAEYLGNWRTVYYVAAGIATLALLALIIAKTIEDNSIEPDIENINEDESDSDTYNNNNEEEDNIDTNTHEEWENVNEKLSPLYSPSPLSPKVQGGRRRNIGGVAFQRNDNLGTDISGRSLMHDMNDITTTHPSSHPAQANLHNESFEYSSSDESDNEKVLNTHTYSPSSSSGHNNNHHNNNEWRPKHYRRRLNNLCTNCVYSRLGDILGLEHLLGLSVEFWLVFLCIIIYSSVFYTFLAFGNDFLQATYGMNAFESGRVVGLISISSCILSPTSGLLLDKVSGRPLAAFIAMVLACISFFLLGFTSLPVVPLVGTAGIAYSILPSALYPIVAEVVPDESFTVVYAAVNAGVNMLLTITVYAVGWISHITATVSNEENTTTEIIEKESKPNYYYVFGIFVVLTGLGTFASGYMFYLRWRKGTLFEKSVFISELDINAEEVMDEESEKEITPLAEGTKQESKKSTKWAPIIRLQPHENISTDTMSVPLSLPSSSLTKDTTDKDSQLYNKNFVQEYQHEHPPPIRASGTRGRTTLRTNPIPIPETASSDVLADLSKHNTMNLVRTTGGIVHRVRPVGPTISSNITGVGEVISSVPSITAASTTAGLSGPVFIRNDGKVYSGLGIAQRKGHNLPMQIMDARHRAGFTRPTLGFPFPFQIQDNKPSGVSSSLHSHSLTIGQQTKTQPIPTGKISSTASLARETDKDESEPTTKTLSKSYAGPYYLEQIHQHKNRRSRTQEPSSTTTTGVGSYILTPMVSSQSIPKPSSTSNTSSTTVPNESLKSILQKEKRNKINVRIDIPGETNTTINNNNNNNEKNYLPLPSRSPTD